MKKEKKVAFIDRDGTMIFEPQDTYQVNSIDQLKILPDVIEQLRQLIEHDYMLIMVTNQDGLGTKKNPQENFDTVQKELFRILGQKGIKFDKVFVCPHFSSDNCPCRKPELGMVEQFLKETKINFNLSFVIGDRATDAMFAKNLRVSFYDMKTNGRFPNLYLNNFD
jgi:imidazoleglycerol-phosphate dehydratase / histidinol-phosphatase